MPVISPGPLFFPGLLSLVPITPSLAGLGTPGVGGLGKEKQERAASPPQGPGEPSGCTWEISSHQGSGSCSGLDASLIPPWSLKLTSGSYSCQPDPSSPACNIRPQN